MKNPGRIFCALALLALFALPSALAQQSAAPTGRLPRAYPGAPPLIPHDVEARKGLCLTCHETGIAGAPIVPHPTRDPVCLQCHVGQDRTAKPFVSETKPAK
jgi:nitrate reductase cytochrome c-type subunit